MERSDWTNGTTRNMAELPELGQQCSVTSCKQLDFLPFKCDACSGIFCKEHRSRERHTCTECNIQQAKVEVTSPKSYPCTYEDCTNSELMPVICEHCNKNLCLQHRHQLDHGCEKYQAPQERMTQTKELIQKIADSKKDDVGKKKKKMGAKSAQMAAKVALMKIKMKADGDKSIPQTERIYFQVFLPKDSAEKSRPMFFSTQWTVGKTVDKIAAICRLRNDNNVATAKKLRLCHCETGNVFPIAEKLDLLLKSTEPVYNGGNVILEYVDNECTCLSNVEDYIS
ncbi:AN1-type zinc finger protein 1-like [Branchiostoma lanceolatum]|uniref:AN1-type zinc finger protein 1-like n=1 Tax=Branchiostoma lanceolatum TaxID=7740 RepID=UPI0034532ED1